MSLLAYITNYPIISHAKVTLNNRSNSLCYTKFASDTPTFKLHVYLGWQVSKESKETCK